MVEASRLIVQYLSAQYAKSIRDRVRSEKTK